ncbi:MAG TPA: response regulator [Cytophagaceae bacterium]|jgi:DNA-binding response OmpR family regulator|nr:response regulator [Cytophagaceae bacterium]
MGSPTVLVIEDEEFISNSIVKALKKEGYGVITTSDYKTSINVIDSAQIDLVVSDVMLPFAGGIDIVEHMKNTPKLSHIPILLVTGMDKDILYSSKIPAEAIISKPFDMSQLVALVNANIIRAAVDAES